MFQARSVTIVHRLYHSLFLEHFLKTSSFKKNILSKKFMMFKYFSLLAIRWCIAYIFIENGTHIRPF